MRLLVDVGNTRLKWALFDQVLQEPQALVYRPQEFVEQLTATWSALAVPQAVQMVSVGNQEVTKELIAWVKEAWGCQVEMLQAGVKCAGVVNGYTSPSQLGADRWAAMVAAYALERSAVCVIDCGTALTCDVIDSNGRHMGGVIAPGLTMMRNSLLEGTAGIEFHAPLAQTSLWGADTASCVQAGGLHASVGLIERVVMQMQQQLAVPVTAVITGGDAESLLPWLSVKYRYEASLVLQGVARIVSEQVD